MCLGLLQKPPLGASLFPSVSLVGQESLVESCLAGQGVQETLLQPLYVRDDAWVDVTCWPLHPQY